MSTKLWVSGRQVVEEYLKSGGKFLFLLEPTSPEGFKPFLAKFGVEFKPKKIVFEASNLKAGSPINVVVVTYDKNHEITKKADMPSILLGTAPVGKLANAPADYKVTSLLSSSSFSYEADYISPEKIKMEKTAPKGPFSLAVAVSGTVKAAEAKPAEASDPKKDKEFRLVVFGDSEFVTNGPLKNAPMNSDLFQNTLSWLALEEDLISIRPKGGDTPDFEITEIRSKVIRATSIVFIPLITIILGVSVWRSRRRK
jgi:ABC-type uncharacterized transport system involved in gliding motility auxiliary subunit